jgi:hypothetical protein
MLLKIIWALLDMLTIIVIGSVMDQAMQDALRHRRASAGRARPSPP